MTLPSNFFFIFPFFVIFPTSLVLGLPDPDPVNVQSFLPARSPPATIPAFPEQSNVAGCPLDLPDELLQGIESACGSGNGGHGQLQKTRCCPVLAAWLYYAYSGTALGRAEGVAPAAGGAPPSSFDNLPLLPDDSETCVDTLGKALRKKGMELIKPNETCDLVYCYCGIRLHPLSCPEAFSLNQKGKLVGEKGVKRLERDCLSSSSNVDGFPGLGGCSNCLNTLYLLNNKSSSSSKSEDRATKMRNKDCQLMGLTWLLAKNRTAYIHTVSNVLRAMMLNRDGSDPHTCALNSDGMPLAVDSSEISNSSWSITKHSVFAGNYKIGHWTAKAFSFIKVQDECVVFIKLEVGVVVVGVHQHVGIKQCCSSRGGQFVASANLLGQLHGNFMDSTTVNLKFGSLHPSLEGCKACLVPKGCKACLNSTQCYTYSMSV